MHFYIYVGERNIPMLDLQPHLMHLCKRALLIENSFIYIQCRGNVVLPCDLAF